jgi:parvulin-like peptidyl-prolyl isomerase
MLNKNRKDLNKVLGTLKKELTGADKKVFTSMSRLYSDGPNAARGGDLGWIAINKLRPEFAKSVKFKPGHIAGPVKTDEGIYFLRTDGYQKPKTVNFEDISSELSKKIEAKRKNKALKVYIDSLRKTAVIRYYF